MVDKEELLRFMKSLMWMNDDVFEDGRYIIFEKVETHALCTANLTAD